MAVVWEAAAKQEKKRRRSPQGRQDKGTLELLGWQNRYKGCTTVVQGMYDGCTRDQQARNALASPEQHARITPGAPCLPVAPNVITLIQGRFAFDLGTGRGQAGAALDTRRQCYDFT